MPIGTPTERYAVSRTVQGASTTLSPASNIAAGTLAVMCVTTSIHAKFVSSVTDDAGGNTWHVDATFEDIAGDNFCVSFISCPVVTQIGTSNVVTINYAVSTNNQCHIWIEEVTGMATSSPFDTSASGSGHSTVAGTPFTTAATGTLAQADEIVFVGTRGSDLTSVAVGSGYTQATTLSLGSAPPLSALEYKIVAATTAVSGNMTHANTSSHAMLLATYKMAAAAGGGTGAVPLLMGDS